MSAEKEEFSIFDQVDAKKIVRGGQRRSAIMIPLNKGKELAEKIAKEMEAELEKQKDKQEQELHA